MSPTILFVTRKYPPDVGGMQEYAYQVYRRLDRHHPTLKISLGRPQYHLVWFVPWVLAAGVYASLTRRISRVHVGDALLAPLGLLLARIAGARASVTTYGLDVVYPPPLYQRMMRSTLPKFDAVICISRAARGACLERGVPPTICHVVHPGTTLRPELPADVRSDARKELAKRKVGRLEGRPLLLLLGRHVRRKGFDWFLRRAVPRCPDSAAVLVAGDGPWRPRVEDAAEAAAEGRVELLGHVSGPVKDLLFRAADAFVMPNRRVPGDMEGFGLVALEATSVGTPVVAADVEGVRDAVVDGETGVLVPEGDAEGFAAAIEKVIGWDRGSVKRTTESTYSWEQTYRGYERALELADESGRPGGGRAGSS